MPARNRNGFALPLTILVMLALASVAAAASFTTMGTTLVRNNYARDDLLGRYADEAIEAVRAQLNGTPDLYPDSGYATIEHDEPVLDAAGQPIPGVTRSVYVGPIGVTSGQYGVHGAIIAVTRDAGGGIAIRRGGVVQESFSKYAYFTNYEGEIVFGGGDQIFGPVHSNDNITIHNAANAATFHGPVSTAGTISNKNRANFRDGYRERVSPIPLPDVADLNKLRAQAEAGGTAFDSWNTPAVGRAAMRIEFLGIDLNGDGDVTDSNEGFIRVYKASSSSGYDWVMGMSGISSLDNSSGLRNSDNCGHFHSDGKFYSARTHGTSGSDRWYNALSDNHATRYSRCFLGGDEALSGGTFTASESGKGAWQKRNWTLSHPVINARADRDYLFPITREMNPNFKGVIHVNGDVAISGTVRGRVTIAASGDIIIADDLRYAIDPGAGTCEDIVGMFAGGDIVVAATPFTAPVNVNGTYRTLDDTRDEFVHGFVLTLNEFFAERHDQGSSSHEKCENTNWGRGGLYLTGGIIQRTRGPVGLSSGTGYLKRYSYDPCGASQPPPYFPTTGRFARGPYLEIDPVGFDVAEYFDMITAGG